MPANAEVALVVPVHHCAGNLDWSLEELDRFLTDAPTRTELVLVDDHGRDRRASALLRQFARREGGGVRLIRNDRNCGKGYSVRRGMLEATAPYRVFTDADLAYPLDEVWRLVARLQRGVDVAIACRVHPESQYFMTSGYLRYVYTRHVMSRLFNRVVRLTLLPGIRDTQAGLKAYTAHAAEQIFPQVRIEGFGFDLECLYLARRFGYRIEEVPVRFRYDDEPSTVRFLRDGATMAADLARIRWRGWTGEYRAAEPPARPGTTRVRTPPRGQPAIPMAAAAHTSGEVTL